MNFTVKRERLDLPENKGILYDYLVIRDINTNEIIHISSNYEFNSEIRLEYDELIYVSDTSGEVLVTLESIINKFKN